jgi:hypothetical protein
MRAFLIFAAVSALGFPAKAEALGPVGPAAMGKVQCYQPNEVAKTCRSIGAYSFSPNGEIENIATMMIMTGPVVIMTTRAPAHIKGDRDCGTLRPEHIDRSTFIFDGRPANAAQTAALRAEMKASLAATFGHETCSAYVPNGQTLLATSTLDGVPQPAADQKMIWVAPADGWRVAP